MPKKIVIITLVFSLIAIGLSSYALAIALDLSHANSIQDIQYVLYVGTNDKDTNKPILSPDNAKAEAEKILIKHFGGYTIQEAKGGWIDKNIVYQEHTLVVYISNTSLEAIHSAANELIRKFNQSSILIQTNRTKTEFYKGIH